MEKGCFARGREGDEKQERICRFRGLWSIHLSNKQASWVKMRVKIWRLSVSGRILQPSSYWKPGCGQSQYKEEIKKHKPVKAASRKIKRAICYCREGRSGVVVVVIKQSNLGDPWDSHVRCQTLVGEDSAISELWSDGRGYHADLQHCGKYSNQSQNMGEPVRGVNF